MLLATEPPAQEKGRGKICQKSTKDITLTSYPGTDLRDYHWVCIFEILEFTKSANSGGLTISGRGGHFISLHIFKEGGPSVITDLQGALRLQYIYISNKNK